MELPSSRSWSAQMTVPRTCKRPGSSGKARCVPVGLALLPASLLSTALPMPGDGLTTILNQSMRIEGRHPTAPPMSLGPGSQRSCALFRSLGAFFRKKSLFRISWFLFLWYTFFRFCGGIRDGTRTLASVSKCSELYPQPPANRFE